MGKLTGLIGFNLHDNMIDNILSAQFCAWRLIDEEDNYWNSGCGTEWFFCEHGPKENRFKFCPTCGKEIVIDE